MKKYKSYLVLLAFFSMILFQNCVGISDMQSARTVGKGNFEITPGFTVVAPVEEFVPQLKNSNQNVLVQGAYGLSDMIDIRMRIEHVTRSSILAIGVGPKISLVKDKLAFYLPVGIAFEDKELVDVWQAQPTILWSYNKDFKKELNLSAKYLVNFSNDYNNFLVLNIGFAFGKDIRIGAFRPEIGYMFIPGSEGSVMHVGLGYTFVIVK